MWRWLKSHPGRAFSLACICLSAGLSFRGAWLSSSGAEWIGLAVITCVAEPGKYFCNVILWTSRSRFWRRLWALIVYIAFMAASGGLMYLPTLQELSQQRGQEGRLVATLSQLEADHRTTLAALEDARTAIVPGLRPSATLRSELRAQLNSRDRALLERELAGAVANEQLAGKIERLTKRTETLAKQIGERSRTFTGHPASVPGHPRTSPDIHETQVGQYVQLLWNGLAIVAAVLIELGIGLGILSDEIERAPPPPVATPRHGSKRFEQWLAKEWKAHRGKDGWLEGSQQGWARAAGFSPGYVHAQLKRMARAGRVEVRADHRNTWVRFVKVAELKIAP